MSAENRAECVIINVLEAALVVAVVALISVTAKAPIPDQWELGLLERGPRCASAIVFLDRYLEIHPRSKEGHAARALAYLSINYFDDAIADSNIALQVDPDFMPAIRVRGRALYGLSRNREAMADFDRLVCSGSAVASDYAFRSMVRCELLDFDRALGDARLAVKMDSSSKESFEARALSECCLGQLGNAISDARVALQIDSRAFSPYAIMAAVLIKKGEYERGIHLARKALRNEPVYAAAYRWIGICQKHLGRYDDALQSASVAISLSRGQEKGESLAARASVFLKTDELDLARLDAENAIKIKPNCILAKEVLSELEERTDSKR